MWLAPIIVLVAVLVVFVAILFELLRDWLDARSCVHATAAAIVLVCAAPMVVLQCAGSSLTSRAHLADFYTADHCIAFVLIFVAAPAAIGHSSQRGAACLASCLCMLPWAILGFGLVLLGPLLLSIFGRPFGVPFAQARWRAQLLSNSGAPEPLDGPRAFWAVCGSWVLITNTAAGAVQVMTPRASTPQRTEAELARLRHSNDRDREELRSLSSRFTLRGRQMSRAQRDRRERLERDVGRTAAQMSKLQGGGASCAATLARACVVRLVAALFLLPPALCLALSLTIGILRRIELSPCGIEYTSLGPRLQPRVGGRRYFVGR